MTSVRVDGFFCLASDGTIEECNQKFCELTGYSREELLSMRYCDLAPSETVDRLHERLSGAADRQGAVYVIDYLRKDGLRVPLETALAFFHGAEFPHFAGFARPVEANAESPSGIDRRYRDLVESLPQIVFETDEQGNLVFANGAAFRAFGYGPEALVAGFNVLEVFAPEDASRAERDFRQALAGENRGPNDYRVLRNNGTIIHAPGTITVLADRKGSCKFEVKSWTDKPYYVLVNGLTRQPQVKLNGQSVALASPHQFLHDGGNLILQVQGETEVEITIR